MLLAARAGVQGTSWRERGYEAAIALSGNKTLATEMSNQATELGLTRRADFKFAEFVETPQNNE